MRTETRFERGHRQLSRIDRAGGQAIIDALADIAPDFATYLLEFPFGDIYSREGLSLRDQEIATIAALAAMGSAQPQLKVHIQAGLNVGLTRDEITEILMQNGRLCRFSRCPERAFRRARGVCIGRSYLVRL